MTWRSLICSSLLTLGSAGAATVTGSVVLRDSNTPEVRKKSDYSGVVVWLEPTGEAATVPVVTHHVRMVQKDKTFSPHVLAIITGTTVDFPNFDPIFHNAFSNYNGQVFDVGLYPPGSSRSVRFNRPGIVRVFCNIHANMSALIVVLRTPWFATTGPDGHFSIPSVPPGEYKLSVFHERATQHTLDALQRQVTVDADSEVLPPIGISESGYLPIPHKNKYGRDYPPPPDAGSPYPSVR